MDQSTALLDALKRNLKLRGLTYRDVAAHLDISEASVKRLFTSQNISLERLNKVCELANLNFIELVKQMDADMHSLDQLTEAQESELVADTGLLLIAFVIINGMSYADILHYYNFEETRLIQYLARLDRLRLIELLPNNRFILRISPNFAWRKNGPIQQFFRENLQQDFFNSYFSHDNESLLFLTGTLTKKSISILQKKLEDLAAEFNELNRQDVKRPLDERWLTSLILAMRPWSPAVFDRYLD